MRLRLAFDGIVLFDLTLLEPEVQGEDARDVHDLSTHHEIGFRADNGPSVRRAQ